MIRHTTTLLIGFIGSGLIALPNWVRPLLKPQYAALLDSASLRVAQPGTYWHLAVIFFGASFLYASFLAWNEERDSLERLTPDEPDLEGELIDWHVQERGPAQGYYVKESHLVSEVRVINHGAPTAITDWEVAFEVREKNGIFSYVEPMGHGLTGFDGIFSPSKITSGDVRHGHISCDLKVQGAIVTVEVRFRDFLKRQYTTRKKSK